MENRKGLVIITYRDRLTHLNCLVPYLQKYFPALDICVAEQYDTNFWNKGFLYNAAFNEMAQDYDYIILHDVDFIPDITVDYSYCDIPTMIAGAASQFNYQMYYPSFFGGVVVCSCDHYRLINGFSNRFRGYGGEDDHFRNSFIQKGIQTTYKIGRFECFAHPKPNIWPQANQYYNHPDYQHNLRLVQQPRDFTEGLSTTVYSIYSKETTDNYTHLKIKSNE